MTVTDAKDKERVLACLRRHPDWDDQRVRDALNVPTQLVRDARAGNPPAARPGRCRRHPQYRAMRPPRVMCADCLRLWAAAAPSGRRPAVSRTGISRNEFMSLYDPTTRTRNMLKAAVKMIERGKFYKDHELRRMASCSDPSLWRALASDPAEGFTEHQFRMGDQVWWSDPASVADIIANHARAKGVS